MVPAHVADLMRARMQQAQRMQMPDLPKMPDLSKVELPKVDLSALVDMIAKLRHAG
jgi:hypothetical protein